MKPYDKKQVANNSILENGLYAYNRREMFGIFLFYSIVAGHPRPALNK